MAEQKMYIRFGEWDTETECSYNAKTGEQEAGVSCYTAYYDDEDKPCYGFNTFDDERDEQAVYHHQNGIAIVALWYRPIFILSGDEVGRGGDNEPLIRNIKIVSYAKAKAGSILPISKEEFDDLHS